MGKITILANNFFENASGSIRDDAAEIVTQSAKKVIQNGDKGVNYDKNKDRKPPTDIRITKVEGPFDAQGKLVENIVSDTSYVFKATPTRKPTVAEVKLLKWSIKLDEGKKEIVLGTAPKNKLEGDKIIIPLKIGHDFKKAKVYAFYQKANDKASVELSLKIRFPILILQGTRRKGKKAIKVGGKTTSTNMTSLDMLFGDYTEDEEGYAKLESELYQENYDVEKQDSFYNVTSRSDNALKNAEYTVSKIKKFTEKSNTDLFEIFRNDIEYYSQGDLETVAHEMVDKMKANTGGEYSNKKLTEAALKHENSVTFISKVKEVINEYLKQNKGNIENLEIKDDSNGKLYADLADIKKARNPQFSDKFSGLGITINDVWAYQIYITKYKTNGNTFEMGLEYIYYDHFGLDYPDIQKYDKNIFYSWFVLQHFRGFKPFITKLDIVGELKGTF
jgi:uncharacterized protein (TIGR03034 family)